jgi:glycosyltransferase involved in cell wall biosynthesis
MLISILTITYQCEKFIDRCYFSILSQTYQDWEWVIFDDGSVDDTFYKIKNLNDNRIKYFRSKSNCGRGLARNQALEMLSGSWCVILDMDDLMDPRRLEFVYGADLEGYDYLVSSIRLIDDNYYTTGFRSAIYHEKLKLFTHASLCVKSDVLRKIKYSEFKFAEDQRVILLVSHLLNGKIVDYPLYIYHENASINLTSAIFSNYFAFKTIWDILFIEKTKPLTISLLIYLFNFLFKIIFLSILRVFPKIYSFLFFFRNRKRSLFRFSKDIMDYDEFLVILKNKFSSSNI